MAATWLVDFAEYLEDQAVGTVGTSIFEGFLPPTPAEALAVYDAGGSYTPQGVAVPWEEHRVEIRVRSTSHAAATTLANKVITAANHKNDVTMNASTVVRWMRPDTTPALIEYDHQRRAVLLVRVTMQVQRSMVY